MYFQCTALTSTLYAVKMRKTLHLWHTTYRVWNIRLLTVNVLASPSSLVSKGTMKSVFRDWIYGFIYTEKYLFLTVSTFFPDHIAYINSFPAPSTRAIHSWLHTLVQNIASYVNCLTLQDHGIKNRSMVVNTCITTCMPRHAQSTHKTLYLSPSFHNDCWSAHNQTPSPSCNHLGYKSSGGI